MAEAQHNADKHYLFLHSVSACFAETKKLGLRCTKGILMLELSNNDWAHGFVVSDQDRVLNLPVFLDKFKILNYI